MPHMLAPHMPYRSQKCGLHQIGRVGTVLMSMMGVVANLYSLTRVLRIRHKRRTIRRGFHAHLKAHLNFSPGEDPPIRYTASESFRKEFVSLLSPRSLGKDHDVDSDEAKTVLAYVCFFNGDPCEIRPTHFCSGCCRSRKDAVKKACAVTDECLFKRTSFLYESARWMHQMPSVREWMRILCVHNMGMYSILRCKFKEESGVDAPAVGELDERARQAYDIGLRLRNGRNWMTDKCTRFRLLLLGLCMDTLEEAVGILFSSETVTSTSAPIGAQKRSRKKPNAHCQQFLKEHLQITTSGRPSRK